MRAILVATFVAGFLDIMATSIVVSLRGISPLALLRGIAAGALGKAALTGGLRTAALGLLFHFAITAIVAAVFVCATAFVPSLIQQPLVAGPLYGIAVYLVMNFIVVPRSALHRSFPSVSAMAIQLPIHMICVGLPIALITQRFARTG